MPPERNRFDAVAGLLQSAVRVARSAPQSPFFTKAQQKARSLVDDRDQLLNLAKSAQQKMAGATAGPRAELSAEGKALLRMVAAYARGEYRDVSVESMLKAVAAVVYVVSPIDLIPDFLPVGMVDDATVLAFALRTVHEEVTAFLEWERAQVEEGSPEPDGSPST